MKPPKTAKSQIPFEKLLSDELDTLGNRFAEFRGGSLYLNGEALDRVLAEFTALRKLAKQYENEISMLAWNSRATTDHEANKQANRALLCAINDPNSNVVVMPARRPYPEIPFGGGPFEEGA